MDTHRPKADIAQQLSADQAGRLLDISGRHVRRLIARGDLEGTRDPYRTTRAAVDAYRFKQRTNGADTARTQVHERSLPTDPADQLVDGLMSELAQTRRQLMDMAREVGRLEASLELAHLRRRRGPRAQRGEGDGPKRENGHRAGVWGRVGLWLSGRS